MYIAVAMIVYILEFYQSSLSLSLLFVVFVLRDQYPPRYPQQYSTFVLENQTVSHVLLPDFEAVDADLQGQMMYRVVGDGLAPVFFSLNADDKPIIRYPLIYAPSNEYKVRIEL